MGLRAHGIGDETLVVAGKGLAEVATDVVDDFALATGPQPGTVVAAQEFLIALEAIFLSATINQVIEAEERIAILAKVERRQVAFVAMTVDEIEKVVDEGTAVGEVEQLFVEGILLAEEDEETSRISTDGKDVPVFANHHLHMGIHVPRLRIEVCMGKIIHHHMVHMMEEVKDGTCRFAAINHPQPIEDDFGDILCIGRLFLLQKALVRPMINKTQGVGFFAGTPLTAHVLLACIRVARFVFHFRIV